MVDTGATTAPKRKGIHMTTSPTALGANDMLSEDWFDKAVANAAEKSPFRYDPQNIGEAPDYDRTGQLLKLLPTPVGVSFTPTGGYENSVRIVALLVAALRNEHARGVARHWTYSLTRELALREALAHEKKRISEMRELREFAHELTQFRERLKARARFRRATAENKRLLQEMAARY